ncbi:MAG: cellulose biosynthesis cyclic di-GMP-binding regulatory protein BcsB, partial [Candidatus Adiutrix sp.]
LHLVLPMLTENMMTRAFPAVQRMAMTLGERPMRITVSSAVDPNKDTIIIGDGEESQALLAAGHPSPFYGLLGESDIPNISPRKYILNAGDTSTFKELGLETATFYPASSPKATRFLIPTPTNLTPNRSLTVALDFAYSPGLGPNSKLQVGVNQEILTTIPLKNSQGSHEQKYRVQVPTSLLEKGFNTLIITPFIEPTSGNHWDHNDGDFSATVFSSSSLTLPKTGLYVRLPELSTIFTDGFPFIGEGIWHLTGPNYEKAASLLTLGALIAQRRGTEGQRVTISFDPWQDAPRNAVIFDLDETLPPSTLRLDSSLIPSSNRHIKLSLNAPSEAELLAGTHQLWN